MVRTRYRFDAKDAPHFLTDTVVEWLPVFTRREAAQILFDSWTHLQRQDGLRLYGYVVLENHLHVVAQADDLPRVWARFKSFTARRILDLLEEANARPLLDRMLLPRKAARGDRVRQFWQEGSHPKVIQGPAMLRQKLDYIHANPVKRGYVDAPEDWCWSSARNYAGREGVVAVCMDW